MRDASFRRHLAHEAKNPRILAGALDAKRDPNGDRHDTANDCRTKNAMLRKAERNGATSHDLGFQLGRRNAFEKTLVVAAP